jgi:mannosyltransferase OCH1-like enzyme
MKNCIQELQNTNPEFKYHLFDDNDCRNFIEKYFSKNVLDSFDKLIPGAYKADLWRYCILYIYGGIYLDIKFYPVNNFKLINLTNKEYFCRDVALSQSGIYNAIIVSKPKNELLMIAINRIVQNVSNNFYGTSSLEPTGPLLLKNMRVRQLYRYHVQSVFTQKTPY